MKKLLYLLALCAGSLYGQDHFEEYFKNESLRIDFILAGNRKESRVYMHSLKRQPFWGGSRKNLVDTSGYGSFQVKVVQAATGNIIFSRGFCTLFQEWQTTEEATGTEKGFFQSVVIPCPRDSVRVRLSVKDNYGNLQDLFSMLVDPSDYFIQPSPDTEYEVVKYLISGEPSECVDIVFLPEGYIGEEMEKFTADVKKLTDTLFTFAPFSRYREKFNIYAVLAPSEESGTDIPGKGVWKNTKLNTSFYTFNIDRYLTARDFWKVMDLASHAPYDQVYILVNSDR